MTNRKSKVLVSLITALALVSMARAEGTPAFDYTAYSTVLTAGLVVVGTIASAIAAIKAGVMVWGKIAKYFQKAG